MNLKPKAVPIPLVIWGASGHARVVADIVRLTGNFNLVGFLDSVDLSRKGTEFCGAPILGGEEQLEFLRENKIRHLILGLGDCQARLSLAATVSQFGFELATVVHPRATVSKDVFLGPGTVIMAGAVGNPEGPPGARSCAEVTGLCAEQDTVKSKTIARQRQ